MKQIESGDSHVSTDVLAKRGVTAIGSLIGGVGLMVLGVLPPIMGLIAGGVVGVAGISGLLSRDPEDRKPALLVTAAGALAVFSKVPIVRPIAASLLGLGAIGLIGLGIYNGIKFLKGLKSRG
jgi:hypothetical protein